MGRHGLPNFLVLREGIRSLRRDPLAPPAQTRSSISRCRSREIALLGESDGKARGPLPTLGMPCWDARVQLRHGVRVCLQGPPAVTSTPWRPRDRRTSKAATTACGHDRRRCTRAQSQHAVPGQPMGRGAGVDRPGPAITRL
jgi:hypothetical protein